MGTGRSLLWTLKEPRKNRALTKETCEFRDPTNRCHPIRLTLLRVRLTCHEVSMGWQRLVGRAPYIGRSLLQNIPSKPGLLSKRFRKMLSSKKVNVRWKKGARALAKESRNNKNNVCAGGCLCEHFLWGRPFAMLLLRLYDCECVVIACLVCVRHCVGGYGCSRVCVEEGGR